MYQTVNDDVTPSGVTNDQLEEWLKRAHWTKEMLAQAMYTTPRQILAQIGRGNIKAVRAIPNADPIIPVEEVRRLLGREE